MSSEPGKWSLKKTEKLYGIRRWGLDYFGTNKDGHLTVRPLRDGGGEIDVRKAVDAALARGLKFPLLLRFQDLLRDRVVALNETFAEAIRDAEYSGQYRGVFPIKVNQLREVVEEILDAGAPYHYGIEAGSKPELFAAMAMHNDSESLVVCNGYKDRLFVETALLGCQLGKQVVMVVEKLEELHTIITVAEERGVKPLIGIRVRLQARGAGRWASSSGDEAKFGLPLSDLLSATELLRAHGLEDHFTLLHFHVGSQIPDIRTVKRAVREAARYYCKLSAMGFGLKYLDVGGGLAVDYDGSRTANDSSMNYSLAEYCRDIVWNVKEVCDEEGVAHPHLVSESGRAIVAYHSVLIVDVFGVIDKVDEPAPTVEPPVDDSTDRLIAKLLELRGTITAENRREYFHDAIQNREDAQARFDLGLLDLPTMARIDSLFWEVVETVVRHYADTKHIPPEIEAVMPSLGDQFLCNFSVFQSLIDHWAVGHLFPIAPIHRLNEKPRRMGTIVDITCDSDGKISRFIGKDKQGQATLPLHEPDGNPYLLGIFLMGAYQDIMGDLHNLFGRVNEAHIFLDKEEDGGYYIEETLPGNTIGQVLSYVQHDPATLTRALKKQVDAAIKSGRLRSSQGMRLLAEYEQGLHTSTYLKIESENA